MKDKRLQVKISGIELNYIRDNLPPTVDSVAEFIRIAAKDAIDKGTVSPGQFDASQILDHLDELHEKNIFEIQQNRALITGVQHIVQNLARQRSVKLKTLSVEELVQHYVDHQDQIHEYGDFARHVKFDHLSEFAMEAIDELVRKGLISMNDERVIWHG